MERLAGRIILLWGWRRALVAFVAGAATALAQPPFDFFAVGFLTLPVLVWLLDGASAQPGERAVRRALRPFLVGWMFGFGYFLAGLWWIGAALLVEADLFAWALPLAVFGIPAILAAFYGLATALARLFWSDGVGRIAALAAAFGIAEWLRSFVLTGFPWNAIGQTVMPVPVLMQSVGAVGMVGMNTLAVLVLAMPALLAARKDRVAGFALAALLIALHVGYGFWRLAAADPDPETLLNVRIVQPSIEQTDKWDAELRDRIFSTYMELSARPHSPDAPRPDLIVWPETALPFFLSERPDALVALGELVQPDQTLFVGAVRLEDAGSTQPDRYYNAVVAINDRGETYDAVDKIRLVPFGEYLPLADVFSRLGMRQLVQSVSAFSPGGPRRTLETASGVRALPFICYEIIFPGIAGHGDADADLILNLTNDAWFGDTPGPYQHFRQAQIRSVEAGLPMVRSGNNGISGVVDAYGRVVDAFALDTVGVLDIAVPRQRLTSPTPPVLMGVAILLLAAFAAVVTSLMARRSD